MSNKMKSKFFENLFASNFCSIFLALLYDFISVILIFFGATLLSEALIPGVVTARLGWRYLAIFLMLTIGAIYFLNQKTKSIQEEKSLMLNKKNRPYFYGLIALAFLGGFWRGSWSSFFMALLAFLIVWQFLKIQKEKEN